MVVAALVVALLALSLVLLRPTQETPVEFHLVVLDERGDQSTPLDPSSIYSKLSQKNDHARLEIRPASSVVPLDSIAVLLDQAASQRDQVEQSTLFFRLQKPYADTKKALHAAIDRSEVFKGQDRMALMRRIIVIREVDAAADPASCERLNDDIEYAKWMFLGIGLLVREETIEPLKQCMRDEQAPKKAA
ncbi:MAG: hypothetical protein HY021_05150 [Burkholderiales bacterium]|nr:hypothetical protein [Burkholderiales bacterium]